MSINVEMIGTGLVVQHYAYETAGKDHRAGHEGCQAQMRSPRRAVPRLSWRWRHGGGRCERDFVEGLVRLQAEAAGDDLFLDLGRAAED